jgi:hypothetical protein
LYDMSPAEAGLKDRARMRVRVVYYNERYLGTQRFLQNPSPIPQ